MTNEQRNRDGMGGQNPQGRGQDGRSGQDDLHRDDDKTRRDQIDQNIDEEQGQGSGRQGERTQQMGGQDRPGENKGGQSGQGGQGGKSGQQGDGDKTSREGNPGQQGSGKQR